MAGQSSSSEKQEQIHLVQPMDMTHDDEENNHTEDDQIISSENVKTRQTAATVDEGKYGGKESDSSKHQKVHQPLKLQSQNLSSKSLKNVKTVEYQLDEDEEDEDVNDFDVHKEDQMNMWEKRESNNYWYTRTHPSDCAIYAWFHFTLY